MNNIKVNANMSHEELIKELRWHDMKDCYRYKELLESEDVEVIKLAVELLTIDGIEKCQIDRCREVFLHQYRWDQKWLKNIVCYEPKYNNCFVSVVV